MSSLKLVTDRTEADRIYLEKLNAKGWGNMTEEERFYWRSGSAEVLELLDGTLETSDGYVIGAGDGVTRGAYNEQDMNRVEAAVQTVAVQAVELLKEISDYLVKRGVATDTVFALPYTVEDTAVEPPQTWTKYQLPFAEELTAYLDKVRRIKGILVSDAPEVPADMLDLQIDEANNIEKVLLAVENALLSLRDETKDRIDRTTQCWLYSGEFFAGEV